MERKLAPEGCGTDPTETECYACSVRHARKANRFWRLKQLLPLQYVAYYTSGGDVVSVDGELLSEHPSWANFDSWRMWMGKVFNHEHKRYRIAE
jgi:hypothetical protein